MKLKKILTIKNVTIIMVLMCFVMIGLFLMVIAPAAEDQFYIDQFLQKKESFEKLKDRVLTLQKEYKAPNVELYSYHPQYKDIFIIGEQQKDNPIVIYEKISLTQEELGWINDINEVCEPFSYIIYENQRMVFGMEGNPYAFVYTVSGKKPTYMTSLYENRKWRRRKIGGGWYFFRTKY